MSSEALNEARPGPVDQVAGPGFLVLALASLVGVAVGTAAQFLRQDHGPVGALGGSTAPWVTIGFLLAFWVARRGSFSDRVASAGLATATYLLAWLVSYHAVFALRESVPLSAAWLEARPWVVAVAPVSVGIGLVATWSQRAGRLGDVALAAPIAWSLPEALRALERGWSYALVLGLPIVALALAPLLLASFRRVRLLTVACSTAVLGVVAYLLASSVLGY